jgi:hypothetical protein
MTVVDLKVPKPAKRSRRGLPLEQATGAARFFEKTVREIETDLGGRRQLSRIESELIRAFPVPPPPCNISTCKSRLAKPLRSILVAMRRSPLPCYASAPGSDCSVGRRM